MTLGRKILFFLCYGAILGDSFRQEALDYYLTRKEMEMAKSPGSKIQTIKWVRVQTAWGLKESKLFVDRLLVDVGLLEKDYFRDGILRTQ